MKPTIVNAMVTITEGVLKNSVERVVAFDSKEDIVLHLRMKQGGNMNYVREIT